jgi:hypothetical protein
MKTLTMLGELIKVPLSLLPMILIVGISTQKRIAYLKVHPLRDASLPQERIGIRGMHIYGDWANPLYGIYDSFPSHPEIDKALIVGKVTGDKELYLSKLAASRQLPLYILDTFTLGNDSSSVPSFQDLIYRSHGKISTLSNYRQIASGKAGILYEYIWP